jgi:cytochrome c biogenesis protein ResB
VVPHTPLKWQAADAPEDAKPEEIGDLSAGTPLEREGVTLLLENPRESSVLSYRHDPGVPLLYIAIVAFMIGLVIRTYWPSYRVNLWIEGGPGSATGRLLFRAAGMLGEPEEVEADLVRMLEAGS